MKIEIELENNRNYRQYACILIFKYRSMLLNRSDKTPRALQ